MHFVVQLVAGWLPPSHTKVILDIDTYLEHPPSQLSSPHTSSYVRSLLLSTWKYPHVSYANFLLLPGVIF